MVTGDGIRLRDKRLADAENDYIWQTDSGLAQLDAIAPLAMPFSQYLSVYASELGHPSRTRRQFAVETVDGEHIGNCGYYHINETKGEAELGIMIGNRAYRNKGFGTDAVTALLHHIFCQTSLKRVYLKTLEQNIGAQKCFRKCGFIPYGRMNKDGFCFILMEIHRNQWEEHQRKVKRQNPV